MFFSQPQMLLTAMLLMCAVSVPLILAAFILSIAAMAQGRVIGGLLAIMLSLLLPSCIALGIVRANSAKFSERVSAAAGKVCGFSKTDENTDDASAKKTPQNEEEQNKSGESSQVVAPINE